MLVLRDACHNRSLAYEVFRLGGIRTLIDGMLIDHVGIGESCAILLNVLVFRRAKRVCRRSGGISKLVGRDLREEIDTSDRVDQFAG